MKARKHPPTASRGERPPSIGEFLRARRDRLRPADFDLPAGTRRRAPGLRREEAAQLCGISPTWYTWIEQGRTATVSTGTLRSIARGLRLSRAESTYLFRIATHPQRIESTGEEPEPRGLDELVRAIRAPAYILDRHWDAVAWNKEAAALFSDWLGTRAAARGTTTSTHLSPGDRNLLRYVFLHPQAPTLIVDWQERSRRLVAEYRADTAGWEDDPVRRALIAELCAASTDFEMTWRSQRVLARDGGIRKFHHRKHGSCQFEQHTLRVAQSPDLKLTLLLPRTNSP